MTFGNKLFPSLYLYLKTSWSYAKISPSCRKWIQIQKTLPPLTHDVETNKHRTSFLGYWTNLLSFDESFRNTFFVMSDKEFRFFVLPRLRVRTFYFVPFSRTVYHIFSPSPIGNICFGCDFDENFQTLERTNNEIA